MEEDVGNPLILVRPFLATSRALIDMESGELMLRIHDECLVLQVYKAMHPPRDSMNCMKMEEVDPTSTKPPDKKDKGPKKKSKEEKGKTIDSEEFQQIPKAPNMPPPPANMEATVKPLPRMLATTTLSHHKNNLNVKLSDDKQALDIAQNVTSLNHQYNPHHTQGHVLASPKRGQNVAKTRSIPSPTNPSLKHLTFPDTHTLPPPLFLAFQRGPNVDGTSPSQSLAHKPSSLTQEPSPTFPTHIGHPKRGTNAVPMWDNPSFPHSKPNPPSP
ncbi:hypothetical protein PIB30_085731 [Stylosanthes scabra]|uniref:Uncharacterized protein n=1 Tax=Stylosanthes scabra TaxID=79078 RepID=A0ABU6QT20_9FABA|nr:hypothetical protein [Stylosanthes scabra]